MKRWKGKPMMLRGGCLAFQGWPGVAEQRGVTLPELQLGEGQSAHPPTQRGALLHEYPLRVGRRGPHFSGPSAGATLRG